jgi:hypothetical protein
MWGEKYKFSQRKRVLFRAPKRHFGHRRGLSNTYRTSALGVAQYRVKISVPGTARVTAFCLFGINQLVFLYGS